MKLYPTISTTGSWIAIRLAITYEDTLPYEDDAARDQSKFFMVYETGDNTTVAEGEATPAGPVLQPGDCLGRCL